MRERSRWNTCETCGNGFECNRFDARFCSPKCARIERNRNKVFRSRCDELKSAVRAFEQEYCKKHPEFKRHAVKVLFEIAVQADEAAQAHDPDRRQTHEQANMKALFQ